MRRKTSYDLAGAALRIRATQYPQAQDFAERQVLKPASEEAILETYGRAELK